MSSTLLHTAERLTILLGVCATALCGLVWGPSGFVSAAAGGALAAANLWVIRKLADRAVRATLADASASGLGALLAGMFLKMIALFALAWVGLNVLGFSLLPFGLGLFVFVVALLGAGLFWGLRDRGAAGADALASDGLGAD
jgi:hypothetical protein